MRIINRKRPPEAPSQAERLRAKPKNLSQQNKRKKLNNQRLKQKALMSKESMKVIMLIASAVYDLLVSRVCYGQKLNLDMVNAKVVQQQQKQ